MDCVYVMDMLDEGIPLWYLGIALTRRVSQCETREESVCLFLVVRVPPLFLSVVSRQRGGFRCGGEIPHIGSRARVRARVVRLRRRLVFGHRSADSYDDCDGGLKVSVSTVFPRDLSV